MYSKRLTRGEVLSFRYAPPFTALDVNLGERPLEPHRDAKPHECSVFYFWWAFLRENAGYMECCASGGEGPMSALYADFDDVRGDDFMVWWKRGGRELFCEPRDEPIYYYDEAPQEHDNRNRLLLSFPITGDIERTIAELRAKLRDINAKERVKRRAAARAADATGDEAIGPRYNVASKPVLSSLYKTLMVWRARQASPDAAPYEIARAAGILSSIAGEEHDAEHRDRVRRTVRRLELAAEALIENVGRGRFPVHTKDNQAAVIDGGQERFL